MKIIQTQKNSFQEQIQKMNEAEAVLHEQRRIKALNKVRELRRQLKEKENANNDISK